MSISLYYPFFVNFLNSSFTTFPSTQVCFCDLLHLLCSSLGLCVLICPPFLQSGLASHPFLKFFIFIFKFFFVVATLALVVGMQDNESTDAQVGDAGGLFKSLDPAPCGAVPAYLIQCSSSSLPVSNHSCSNYSLGEGSALAL